MALATAPSTPERTGLPPSIRRSFTAPTNSCRSAIPIPQSPGEGAETLYAHTACKIISFSHTSSTGRRHSSVSDGRAEFQEHSSGSSPWASATERTIAAGEYPDSSYVTYSVLLTYFSRALEDIQSTWICRLPQLRRDSTAYSSQIAMLVC